MKIFCIGRNYVDHAKELNNPLPEKPMVFMKPATALLTDNKPFYHPEFSQDIHYELEIVLKIDKNGKHILPEFTASYVKEIGLGIDFTARDLQESCKQKGHPWEIAKAFDHSAVISTFVPLADFNEKNIHFELKVNGETRQQGNSADMIFDFQRIITHISQYFTLQKGDLIYTGTPAGVGQVHNGDVLEGYLEGKKMLSCLVK